MSMTETHNPAPVMIAAGGTGGHIFPAEALAEVLMQRGVPVVMVTDKRFADYHIVSPQSAFSRMPLHYIHAGNLSGHLVKKLRGAAHIALGIAQAYWLVKRLKPRAVIGFGGYPSFPTMFVATRSRVPSFIHEQNAVLGRANLRLCDRVSGIATSYPETQKMPEHCRHKTVVTGNPVRAAIRALAQLPYVPPTEDGVLRLLVVGGSQGARIFSEVVPAAIARLPEPLQKRLRVDQQCRAQDIDAARTAYASLPVSVDIAPFFDDMATRLAAAHLVIGRAGASTVAELTCAGRPAILVPLPTAMDNHQYMNAQAVEDAGAGWVMAQHAFTVEALAARLESLLTYPQSLGQSAIAMRRLGCVAAADALADLLLKTLVVAPQAASAKKEQAA